MDEFDRIREISEDLTHRKEPTFTHTVQSSQPQNFANVSNNYTQTQANSTYSQSVGDSFLKSPVVIWCSSNTGKYTSDSPKL